MQRLTEEQAREMARESEGRDIGFAVLVHDPDGQADGVADDYVVGPFVTEDEARSYASGTQAIIGTDGATTVLPMELPHPPVYPKEVT